jgi:hypothetical protein
MTFPPKALDAITRSIDAAPGQTPEQEADMLRDLARTRADQKWVADHLWTVTAHLPLSWTETRWNPADYASALRAKGIEIVDDGCTPRAFRHTSAGLLVLITGAYHDGRRWLHVSASKQLSLPTWTEMADIKRVFIGEDRRALMISPARAYYVNAHPNALHWWCGFDGDGLPEFSRGLGMV